MTSHIFLSKTFKASIGRAFVLTLLAYGQAFAGSHGKHGGHGHGNAPPASAKHGGMPPSQAKPAVPPPISMPLLEASNA